MMVIEINGLIMKPIAIYGRTKKEVNIHTDLQSDIWAIEADQDQIEQVLLNLYVNAFQAMPMGAICRLKPKTPSLRRRLRRLTGSSPVIML
jgi:signal transduction histidine kinase